MFDMLLSFFSRLAGLFGRRRAEQEFDAEIAEHLDLLAEDFMRRGMSPAEASTTSGSPLWSLLAQSQMPMPLVQCLIAASMSMYWRCICLSDTITLT